MWSGTSGGRDDASLVLVDDSPHWQPPTTAVRWGRPDTTRPGTQCETWGVPDEAQRPGHPIEASHLYGEVNPGSGFVGNQYVMDLRTPAAGWPTDGTSPFAGLSGAPVFCDRYLTGVVAADRAGSAHGRLNVVPAYVLHNDPEFRAVLTAHGTGPATGLEAVEFQDLADPAQFPARRPRPATPAALLEAVRQVVPFHGRDDLVTELETWCRRDGFGAWLLHGPGGQGKTRIAHHLGQQLTADGWTVLWPRTAAHPEQLLELRRAARPLLVVLDYAETRPEQLTTLVEAAAEHPGTSPFKLLLLARTAGDWWEQAQRATRLAEGYLTDARARTLTPLEDDPGRRAAHYHAAAQALAAELPHIDGLAGHDWTATATTLTPPQGLGQNEYGNALTLHMSALVDLLDITRAGSPEPAHSTETRDSAHDVEDRLLGHEDRYWRNTATAHGLTPVLSMDTLRTAIAAAHLTSANDREHADHLWQRLPALSDQPRDRRDQVTTWLATLYPATTPGGPPWGTLQPDRLAERHTGRTLLANPYLADRLLTGADHTQTPQLLTVYSRAAAHPSLLQLDSRLTEFCVRHHEALAPHIVTTATRTDHPEPLITALDTITTHPETTLTTLTTVHDLLPDTSHRLALTAALLANTITSHYRALTDANPDVYLPDLAVSLNDLSVRLGGVGRREEGLAAIQEANGHYRALADANPDAHLPDLAMSLNNLSIRLSEVGRREEGLAAIQEANGHYRALADANPDAHLPDLAMSLNNLSNRLSEAGRREEGLTASREAVAIRRALADANPDAYLLDLASSLNNLSIWLGGVGRREEGLTAVQEAVAIRRALVDANPDAHLPDLASSLNNLSNHLGEAGRREEGLAVIREAVAIRRALADANPDAYLLDLASSLSNLSNRLGEVGRWEEGLAAVQEASGHCRALADANPDAYLPDLASSLNNLSNRLGALGRHGEGLTVIREAVAIRRTLADANPDAYLPDLASSLNNLSNHLGETGRREEGLAAVQEASGHYRTLADANSDAYLPHLAVTLHNLSIRLGEAGRREEGLVAIQEAVAIRRALADRNLDAYLPVLAMSLTNLSVRLGEVGRREEGLAAIQEAVTIHRTLAKEGRNLSGVDLQRSLEIAAWLEELE
ncbi:tetratricopeptide repeat protein [Streptomyces hydrogenans]|uniref:tetratricopeptide repeat protein n=1 Tax=Streptomyces hydrogenans TaxID=1873719 RepID=UPI0036382BF9